MKYIKENRIFRWMNSIFFIVVSSFIQTYALQTFVRPSNLLSTGFTGLAILIHRILELYHINFPVSLGILLFNIPAALLCLKSVSLKFTIVSTLQFVLTSFLLTVLRFEPLFDDVILNCLIGGVIYGACTVVALYGEGSTGGTDFISIYVANKIGKSIWSYVFIFNMIMLVIFGYFFGFQLAGYSILFQFMSTKTIEKFHNRYNQLTLQITTAIPEEIIAEYVKYYRHGISVTKGYGGYSKKELYVCNTVISSYELKEIVRLLKRVDNKIIVNVLRTEEFFGGFYRKPID